MVNYLGFMDIGHLELWGTILQRKRIQMRITLANEGDIEMMHEKS